jgi:hypothetical protein
MHTGRKLMVRLERGKGRCFQIMGVAMHLLGLIQTETIVQFRQSFEEVSLQGEPDWALDWVKPGI